mmetsp:Transcript_54344/g.131901  ORF Transcript_54344/g.131901 Transcript_54344/m.131901 type:complete len:265 (+) Transcript_54344:385-1179(+)
MAVVAAVGGGGVRRFKRGPKILSTTGLGPSVVEFESAIVRFSPLTLLLWLLLLLLSFCSFCCICLYAVNLRWTCFASSRSFFASSLAFWASFSTLESFCLYTLSSCSSFSQRETASSSLFPSPASKDSIFSIARAYAVRRSSMVASFVSEASSSPSRIGEVVGAVAIVVHSSATSNGLTALPDADSSLIVVASSSSSSTHCCASSSLGVQGIHFLSTLIPVSCDCCFVHCSSRRTISVWRDSMCRSKSAIRSVASECCLCKSLY